MTTPLRFVNRSIGQIGADRDCCAAATMDLHAKGLEFINMIYCRVVSLEEVLQFFA